MEIIGDLATALGITLAFDISADPVARFIEQLAQKFAIKVNDTTWEQLKNSLSAGIEAGEGIEKLSERVETVMGDRIRSAPEVIARTEVLKAANGAALEAYKQSGVVKKKTWLAALDKRTRESHIEAHQRYQDDPIPLDEDFEVGNGHGPAPQQIGLPEEDIECRCTTQPVIDEHKDKEE